MGSNNVGAIQSDRFRFYEDARILRMNFRKNTFKLFATKKSSSSDHTKPAEYGRVWLEHEGDLDWYTWMYNGRIDQHESFMQWVKFYNNLKTIHSVLEFGCGMAIGYADFFKDIHYVGVDISSKLIDWCRENRPNPLHQYFACDFISEKFDEKFDLVFSQGTIDNVYDMDAFVSSAVRASSNWIYITAYRGYFSELSQHSYLYSEKEGCYYNDLSPLQIYNLLLKLECKNIAILPSYTGRSPIQYETLILAQVSSA